MKIKPEAVAKKRVQAQRKFAQGACTYVVNTSTAAKTDAPQKEVQEQKTIHNGLSAKNLLDIVAFQNIHSHVPVVLLKRLDANFKPSASTSLDKAEPSLSPPARRADAHNGTDSSLEDSRHAAALNLKALDNYWAKLIGHKDKPASEQQGDPNPKPKPQRRRKRIDSLIQLRPTPRVSKGYKYKPAKPLGLVVKRQKRTQVESGLRLRSRLLSAKKEQSTSKRSTKVRYSAEDERPLKYLKLTKAAVQPEPGPSARVTRSAASSVKPNRVAATPAASTKQVDCFKQPKLPIRFTKDKRNSNAAAPVTSSSDEPPSAHQAIVTPMSRPEPQPASPVPSPSAVPPPSAFAAYTGEPQPSTSTAEDKYMQIEQWLEVSEAPYVSASRPTQASTSRESPYVPSDAGRWEEASLHVPSDAGRWEEASLPATPASLVLSPIPSLHIKPSPRVSPTPSFFSLASLPPSRPSMTPGDEPRQSYTPRAPSPCPSESFITIQDVVRAPDTKVEKRCRNICPHCRRVSTVTRLRSILRRPCHRACTDVYDFDPDVTDALPRPGESYRQHGTRAQGTQTRDKPTDDEEEYNHQYLDLFPQDSSHILQLTSIKGKKNKTRARMVDRSVCKTVPDLNLVEHENLLEQLLQILLANEATLECRDPFPAPPPPDDNPPVEMTNKARTKQKSAKISEGAKLVEAPIYTLQEGDINDPIKFFEKIMPIASKYGLCKVVAPESFKPKCELADMLKFKVTNHYISRLYSRWGPAAREMCAMKAYLSTQNITFNRVPLLDSLEVNLPKLYAVVQRCGGLKHVIEKKKWGRVAEEMRFNKGPKTEKMLDSYYVKYLLPYETASNQERQKVIGDVEKCWIKKQRKLLDWATNPLHHQKKLLGDTDSSEDEASDGESDDGAAQALAEAEDCIVPGRPMKLDGFKKVAKLASDMYSPLEPENPSIMDIEKEYWRLVLFNQEHVCVNAASIDTDSGGYGFTKSRQYGKNPWNLKTLSSNSGNMLRSLSKVVGVTVPTLHLGMIYSTSCWHRDPHGLPWIEYMHEGAAKIWYGIPDEQSANFRRAVETVCPTSCQNKALWLSSDITMIPPNLLREHNVSLSRAVQNPGEFIIVFPKAYSCSISTGFTITESVYFATHSWLKQVHQVFREARESCEPTAFSLEQLLIALAEDSRASLAVLQTVQASLAFIVNEELAHRRRLADKNIATRVEPHRKKSGRSWNARDADECQICRSSLFLSKVIGVISKKTPLCLAHAVRLLETPKYSASGLAISELVVYYTEIRLEGIVAAIQKRLLV